MSDTIEKWQIKKNMLGGMTTYRLIRNDIEVGRAEKFDDGWTAMSRSGNKELFLEFGIDVTTKRLCDLLEACADAEDKINADGEHRLPFLLRT